MAGPSPVSSHPNGSSTTHGHAGELGVDHLDGHAPTLRRELVLALRTAGPSSPDQLAALVGASRTGVLQQLRVLETDGLVSRRTERHGVGRPRHLYDVTASAQHLFPTNYDGLAAGLIAAIGAIGGRELVDRVFETRRNQTAERIRRRLDESLGDETPFFERVRELAVVQDEQGYLCSAELSADGTIRLREHNCAIYHVAANNPAACEAELELFRAVLGADIVRETHIAAGDRCCTYRISARSGN
jgi:predicted ArsR family transcriptional regulator